MFMLVSCRCQAVEYRVLSQTDLFDEDEDNNEGAAEEEEEGEADQQHFLQSAAASPEAGGSDPVLEAGRYKHRPGCVIIENFTGGRQRPLLSIVHVQLTAVLSHHQV